MAQITSAKDKNFLGPIAMDLKMDDFALKLMTTSAAVEVPGAFTAKVSEALKTEKAPAKKWALEQALKLTRGY